MAANFPRVFSGCRAPLLCYIQPCFRLACAGIVTASSATVFPNAVSLELSSDASVLYVLDRAESTAALFAMDVATGASSGVDCV